MKKEQMIVSINKADGLQVLENQGGVNEQSSVPDGCMRLSGTFGVTGVMNNNQRYYTNENYKVMVESLSNRIQSDGVFGELEHPNTMNVDLSKVTHKVESISIDESTGVVSGTILLLNNARGKEIQTLVENGLKLKISSRGRGTVSESGEVKLSVLETYDLVYKPGFSEAQLSVLTESVGSDGKLVLETLVSDLDSNGNVIENYSEKDKEEKEETKETKTTSEMKYTDEEKKALKESLKAEILEELKAEMPKQAVAESVDVDAIGDYLTSVVETKIAESEKRIQNHIHESMLKFGKATQNWAFESFAPDIVRYLNEKSELVTKNSLEKTVQGIQEWAVTDFAQGIQSWSINEFAADLEAYFSKSNLTEMEEEDEEENDKEVEDKDVDENLNESENDDKSGESGDDEKSDKDKDSDEDEDTNENGGGTNTLSFMDRIDEELRSIGVVEAETNQINESKEAEKQLLIDAAQKAEDYLMENLPESYKHLWEASSEDFKTQVKNQAKHRDFTNESQVTRFWMNRFSQKDAIKIAESQKQINEAVATESNALVNFAKRLASK